MMALRYLAPAIGPSYSPSTGFKWAILAIYVQMNTSATVGTRSVYIGVNRLHGIGGGSPFTTYIIRDSETGVNTTYNSVAELFPVVGYSTSTLLAYPIIVCAMDAIIFGGSLLSGDSAIAGILIEEVIDD